MGARARQTQAAVGTDDGRLSAASEADVTTGVGSRACHFRQTWPWGPKRTAVFARGSLEQNDPERRLREKNLGLEMSTKLIERSKFG